MTVTWPIVNISVRPTLVAAAAVLDRLRDVFDDIGTDLHNG